MLCMHVIYTSICIYVADTATLLYMHDKGETFGFLPKQEESVTLVARIRQRDQNVF